MTTIAQSPAIDVIGVGHADGRVRVVDIKIGEEIFDVKMEEGGIAGLSFRMGEFSFCWPFSASILTAMI